MHGNGPSNQYSVPISKDSDLFQQHLSIVLIVAIERILYREFLQ